MARIEAPTVEVGQVWIDNDKRQKGQRGVRVVNRVPIGAYAEVMVLFRASSTDPWKESNRMTRIKLDRFRPTATGYRLQTDM